VEKQTRVRLGIIGLGAMGSEMLRVASGHPDYEVVRAADPDEEAVARTAARYPQLSLTRDPGELVSGLDALYIASPPATHAGYALAALAAGTPVFCEKPLAIDLDEGDRMVRAAEQAGLANAVNFALSDRAAAVAVGRAVRDGEVGDVVSVDMRLAFPQWPRAFQRDARWLAGRAQGGFLREVASHFVFLTDRLLGPLTPVRTRVSYGESAESAAAGVFTAGDIPVTLSGVLGAAPETYEWTLYGTKVSYRITGWGDLWRSEGDGWTRVEPDLPRGGEHARLGEFARALRGEPTTLADFASGLRVQRVIEHFHAAA
jgi:1,5-anhydro-D-fructose reductase (1,5-anhydro-D-mannitol-forming)